jgi:hypothetical protein
MAHLHGGKNIRRKPVVQTGAIETGADFLRRPARRDADRLRNLRQGFADVRRGFQRSRKQSENLGVCLGGEVVRQAAAEFGFNFKRRLTHRTSEKPFEYLFRRDRIAVARQRFGMCAA